MESAIDMTTIRFPAVRPELPPISAWAPILEEAYQANWFTNFGRLSRQFEGKLAIRCGRPNVCCIAANNGTSALAAPLIAMQISGKVLLPAFTFPATAGAIKMAGAEPLLMDVNIQDWRISAEAFKEALSRSGAAAAILVVPFGLNSDFSEHIKIAADSGVCLVLDNAAGLGSRTQQGPLVGKAFEVFSLHATKPFGIGEGGAIITSPEHEDALRQAMNFGLPSLGENGSASWGFNGKLSELHAAVGLAVEEDFDRRLSLRRLMAARYIASLSNVSDIRYPTDVAAAPWQLFPILMPSKEVANAFVQKAAELGIELRRYYRPSLSRVSNSEKFSPCTVAEDISERMVCAPIYSAETQERDEVVESVVLAIQSAMK